MQLTENIHAGKTKTQTLLVRISDVELFPAQTTLFWEVNEPTESMIRELFDRRFELMGGNDQNLLKIHTFRVLSKAKIGAGKFRALWMAKVQYLQNIFLSELNLEIKKNQFLFFNGKFTFWRVGNLWMARVC